MNTDDSKTKIMVTDSYTPCYDIEVIFQGGHARGDLIPYHRDLEYVYIQAPEQGGGEEGEDQILGVYLQMGLCSQ
jgi:hypothetical protein